MKKSLTVEVAGQKLTLKTDADEAYVRSLARFVSEKIQQVKRQSRQVATQTVALLAALQIADDLFQERRHAKDFRRRIRAKSQTILDLIAKEANL